MVKITREPWVQQEAGEKIEQLVRKWEHIIPHTLIELRITAEDSLVPAMEIRVNDEYRRATLCIGQEWWTNTTQDPEWVIVHELCHLYTTPIARSGKEAIDMIHEPDSPANKLAWHSINMAMEACTEDLAQMLLRVACPS